MSYQFLDPAPVFRDLSGDELLAGGFLQFYDKGTTTPRDTWSDEALTVLNPNPVPLDAAGRAEFAIWLDGEYSVKAESAAGETIWTRDYTSGQVAGATIPALQADRFLTNDGVSMFWSLLRMLPDPSGMANRILSTDGANPLWIPQPEIPEPPKPDITITGGGVSIGAGEGSKFVILTGKTTLQPTGAHRATSSVTFPTGTFTECLVVLAQVSSYSTSAFDATGVCSTTAIAPAGFTLNYDINVDSNAGGWNMTSAAEVRWVAFGTKAA